jgi:predicted extracellular nuclease
VSATSSSKIKRIEEVNSIATTTANAATNATANATANAATNATAISFAAYERRDHTLSVDAPTARSMDRVLAPQAAAWCRIIKEVAFALSSSHSRSG